jgi:hypothetical protein
MLNAFFASLRLRDRLLARLSATAELRARVKVFRAATPAEKSFPDVFDGGPGRQIHGI